MSELPEVQLAQVLCMEYQDLMTKRGAYGYQSWENVPPDVRDNWISIAKKAIAWRQQYA